MSNFQTVDINNNLLVTGGSYEMLFLDENNNKLYLDSDKSIKLKFPAKIESEFKNNMNVYDGEFIANSNSRELLYWTLYQNERVKLENNFYENIITPEKVNGKSILTGNCDHLTFGSDERLRCKGIIINN